MIQWALNTGFREIYGSTPYHVKFGRAPRRALSTLASSTRQDWQVDVLDDKALRKKVQSVVEVQSQANRGKQRVAVSRGNLSNFAVGEYVVVARVLRSGSTTKFIMTWTGPWRVVVAHNRTCTARRTSYPGRFETSMLLGCVSTRMPLSRSLLTWRRFSTCFGLGRFEVLQGIFAQRFAPIFEELTALDLSLIHI